MVLTKEIWSERSGLDSLQFRNGDVLQKVTEDAASWQSQPLASPRELDKVKSQVELIRLRGSYEIRFRVQRFEHINGILIIEYHY